MFECPTCGYLGINPRCEQCPVFTPLELDELIAAEEITDELLSLDPTAEDFHFDLDFDLNLGDEAVIVDLTGESSVEMGEAHFSDDEDDEDEKEDE
jgi:hypothetical protein